MRLANAACPGVAPATMAYAQPSACSGRAAGANHISRPPPVAVGVEAGMPPPAAVSSEAVLPLQLIVGCVLDNSRGIGPARPRLAWPPRRKNGRTPLNCRCYILCRLSPPGIRGLKRPRVRRLVLDRCLLLDCALLFLVFFFFIRENVLPGATSSVTLGRPTEAVLEDHFCSFDLLRIARTPPPSCAPAHGERSRPVMQPASFPLCCHVRPAVFYDGDSVTSAAHRYTVANVSRSSTDRTHR